MVKFLLHRPIAVTMTFLALLVLGTLSSTLLPVSLMPEIDIPRITVKFEEKNLTARELENAVIAPLRLSLAQVEHLSDIKSETRNGSSTITLDFEYGTRVDYAFIEVNEKIDRAMSQFPSDIERPTVIKASATDIPVFCLNLTLKTQSHKLKAESQTSKHSNIQTIPNNLKQLQTKQFIEFSDFTSRVIRKRIEQLPEVALADLTGLTYPQITIIPDHKKTDALNLPFSEIEQAITQNNINLGNLLIIDGQYQYNIRIGNQLLTKEDIENVFIRFEGRLLQIKDFARVEMQPQEQKGLVLSDGKPALNLAVIKQSDARMSDLEENLAKLLKQLVADYPHIDFTITRDQTKLLDYTISNLRQSLLVGAALAFLIMFFFLRDVKSPILIGITIPTSLLVSLLFFNLAGLSINIVSLSGLILGIGMMIDNSIIVIDNITQHRERGKELSLACISGTNEVFRPMLSSVLTTCAVFIPLVFIKGIAGSLFYEQAMAIAIGLLVSLLVSVTILPVYYRLVYLRKPATQANNLLGKINRLNYSGLYEKGLRFCLRNQRSVWLAVLLMLVSAAILYKALSKERLPQIAQIDMVLELDWNERINIHENSARVSNLLESISDLTEQSTCLIGLQQFLLEANTPESPSEALVYIKTKSPEQLETVKSGIAIYLKKHHPTTVYSFMESGNIFSQLFADNAPPLELRFRQKHAGTSNPARQIHNLVQELQALQPEEHFEPAPEQEQILLTVDPELLNLYQIDYNVVYSTLKRYFRANEIFIIKQDQQFLPVILGEEKLVLHEILSQITVKNKDGDEIRIESLLKKHVLHDLKTIVAGQEGVYFPIAMQPGQAKIPGMVKTIGAAFINHKHFEVGFSGTYFSNRALIKDLAVIFAIALLLLYFILASQFESLTLPIIVLIEVPVDLFGAFLFLWLFGSSINIMSLIGIIVMSGIIINDSILKIDTINKLRAEGYSLIKAIVTAGQRRLKPILMTSLTTILALLPFLFTKGMGADLQRPLAYSVIGGMIVGTCVSLYLVPLCYYYLAGLAQNKKQNIEKDN